MRPPNWEPLEDKTYSQDSVVKVLAPSVDDKAQTLWNTVPSPESKAYSIEPLTQSQSFIRQIDRPL